MKYRLKFGFVLIILSLNLLGNSQNKPNNFALTLDLVGNSGAYSLNGEYEIGKIKDYKLNTRLGFGYLSVDGRQFIGIPIGINMITGTKKHHLELGLGASYIKGIENWHNTGDGSFGNYQDWWQPSEAIYFVPSIGYRFDKLTGGLILKVYYSPLIRLFDFFDKQDFLNRIYPVFDLNVTREEYYNFVIGNKYGYPTAKNQFGNFGVSVGYRF
ncbi:MAG: hypothetical protein WCJ61_10245 [Paludibacter sp.]